MMNQKQKKSGAIAKKSGGLNPLCIGFDPDTSNLHPFLQRQFEATATESFLIRWYQATVQRIAKPGVAIKLQSAFFEQFGPAGIAALRDIAIDAKRRKLYVILDAKRGDISSTMTAYGYAAFTQFQADALTILPWMGTDSLRALLPWMKQGKRIYVVWISSNKSGWDIQLQPAPIKSKPIAMAVYDQFTKIARKEGVLDQVGWVLGATSLSLPLLKKLPNRPHHFLLPGIGAQGAKIDEKARSLVIKHPNSLFPISRGLLKPDEKNVITTWDDYSEMIEQRWNDYSACFSP